MFRRELATRTAEFDVSWRSHAINRGWYELSEQVTGMDRYPDS